MNLKAFFMQYEFIDSVKGIFIGIFIFVFIAFKYRLCRCGCHLCVFTMTSEHVCELRELHRFVRRINVDDCGN